MDGIREYLENSTIHGMNHILKTSRMVRAAWIVIVLMGFSWSGLLIYQSVDNWQQNPVATTISTNPIHQITFPIIYVCPPKNSYTNLNHDIINTHNTTLTDDQIQQLKYIVDEKIEESEKEKFIYEINKYYEENKFLNWYLELSEPIIINSYYVFGYDKQLIYYKNSASSGSIGTPYFKEQFQYEKFYYLVHYEYTITGISKTDNTTLILELDIDLKEITGGSETLVITSYTREHDYLHHSQVASYRLTGPMKKKIKLGASNISEIKITFERDIHSVYVENWSSRRMTGFQIRWYYVDNNNTQVNNQDRKLTIISISIFQD